MGRTRYNESDLKAMAELVREEINHSKSDTLVRLTTNAKLAEITGFRKQGLQAALGYLTNEERSYRTKALRLQENSKYSIEDVTGVSLDFIYFDDLGREIAKNYGLPSNAKVSMMLQRGIEAGIVTEEQVENARQRRYKTKTPAYFEAMSKRDITGEKNSMFGRTGELCPAFGRTGESHPWYGKHHSSKFKQRMSERMSGPNNPNFNGWSSLRGYDPEFTHLMRYVVLVRDGKKCRNCGTTQKEQKARHNQQGLSVHHIDYDKRHNDEHNLVTLCTECHVPTNMAREGNREHWQEYYGSMVERIYTEMTEPEKQRLNAIKERLAKRNPQSKVEEAA